MHCYVLALSRPSPSFWREAGTRTDMLAIESHTAPSPGSSDMSIHDIDDERSLTTHCSTSLFNVCVAVKLVDGGDGLNFISPSARFSCRRIQQISFLHVLSLEYFSFCP